MSAMQLKDTKLKTKETTATATTITCKATPIETSTTIATAAAASAAAAAATKKTLTSNAALSLFDQLKKGVNLNKLTTIGANSNKSDGDGVTNTSSNIVKPPAPPQPLLLPQSASSASSSSSNIDLKPPPKPPRPFNTPSSIGVVQGTKRSNVGGGNGGSTLFDNTAKLDINILRSQLYQGSRKTATKGLQQQQQLQQVEHKRIGQRGSKKRCLDRYDSSESSDSGVATSLSCADSSTGSSEDASEPGSPVSDDHHLHHHHKMPPQILSTSSTSNSSSASSSAPASVATTATATVSTPAPATFNPSQGINTAKVTTTTPTTTMTTPQRNPNMLPTLQWPWNTNLGSTSTAVPASVANKKRSAGGVMTTGGTTGGLGTNEHTTAVGAKKSRGDPLEASKRLKIIALEESQTKITGFFKSQMKASPGGKLSPPPPATTTTTSTASVSASTPSQLTMSTPATTASLNKYFNILSQLKEQKQQQAAAAAAAAAASAAATASTSTASATQKLATPPPTVTMTTPAPPPIIVATTGATASTSLPVPALKKIERSTKQPAKIAQVAPNLRKTPSSSSSSSSSNGSNSSSSSTSSVTTGKSPAKKHVAIAPRTPEMKQLMQQNKSSAMVYRTPCQKLAAAPAPPPPPPPTAVNPPPPPQPTANPTLYQLPAVQLPNLVQLPPQLAAAANIMQLNNVAKAAVAAAANNNAAAQAAQAAQAAAAQFFLNGTVFKLQQVTTATTTTATTATAAAAQAGGGVNPFGLLSTNELQELFIKQQQFQQLQAKPPTLPSLPAPAPPTAAQCSSPANPANLQELFQQQIAAAAALQQQQQVARLVQQQQQQQGTGPGGGPHGTAGGAATAQPQPVFMATPAGLLLNAATLPAMLAQAAAAISAANQQQQQKMAAAATLALQQHHQQHQHHQQQVQAAAAAAAMSLQPLPALSSIFEPTPEQQQQQQSMITASNPPAPAPPPLANGTNSNNTATNQQGPPPQRVMAKAPPTIMHSSSQPPPLVTISSSSTSTGKRPNTSSAGVKPYQKRIQTQPPQSQKTKFIATPTTPPPLVPTSSNKEMVPALRKTTNVNNVSVPTPPLVSIAPSKLTPTLSLAKPPPTQQIPIQMQTQISPSPPDLFDLVKNSNGAISIVPKPTMTITMTSPLPFSSPSSRSSPALSSSNSCTLSAFSKISKIEATETTTKMSKAVAPQSFAGQLPKTRTPPVVEHEPLPELMQDCSNSNSNSNSCSSYSNSVSSAADLSLEASTPASPSPAPSPSGSSSGSGSGSGRRAASQTDMLSEMVTSSCISSGGEDCSQTTQSTTGMSPPLSVVVAAAAVPPPPPASSTSSGSSNYDEEDDKSESVGSSETHKRLRDLPTPESGIGGSLSNSESSNSIIDASSSLKSISACPPTSAHSDSNSSLPPASPDDSSSTAATMVDVALAESVSKALPKSAISPILSQPKTIRFPAGAGGSGGKAGAKRHDGVCYWDKCNKKHESNSKLLDHMQTHHVNTQTGPFACLWVGCKVYNKESCSRRWLERHVLSHGGSKQFKCIVEGCGLRFGSQLALQKHVNNHFNATDNIKESTSKRTSDPPVPKQLRKNGKKLRYRRQPFSARMFDFFDTGIMEGLQHRLRQISTLTNGAQAITFQGQCLMRRRNSQGCYECFVRWSPREIISDEWLPECPNRTRQHTKVLHIKHMRPAEKTRVESLLSTAFKLRYDAQLFADDYNVNEQQEQNSDYDSEDCNEDDDEDEDDEEDDDEGENDDYDDDDEEEEDDGISASISSRSASNETVSSYQQVLTIAKLQMQQRRKHPRKPPKIRPPNNPHQQSHLVPTDALVPI